MYHTGGSNSTTNKKLYIDGSNRGDVHLADGSDALNLVSGGAWTLGSYITGSSQMQGSIAEVLVYDKVLPADQRSSVRAYLMKNGLMDSTVLPLLVLLLTLMPISLRVFCKEPQVAQVVLHSCPKRSDLSVFEIAQDG